MNQKATQTNSPKTAKRIINLLRPNALLAFLMALTLSLALPTDGLSFNREVIQSQSVSLAGVNGYDLVSFHTGEKPLRGNGNHVAVIDGINYLFINEDNKKTFERNPQKYLPAYGGFCAFGVAVGKKFAGDPDVWKIVDGKLYLNLDTKIQTLWNKDIEGNIKKADKNWRQIKDTPAQKL